MFQRQTSGSCSCVFCHQLIAVDNLICPHCHRRHPTLWGYSQSLQRLGLDLGFSEIVIWGCIALYLTTLLIDITNIRSSGLSNFLSPSIHSLFLFGASGALPVFTAGRWWTVLSSGWLHGNFLHIVFNLLWIRKFAPEVAEAFGAGRLALIYTVAIVSGSLLSSIAGHIFPGIPVLQGSMITIGASGGIFGLLGALVAYGQISGHFLVRQQALSFAVVVFLFGLFMPNVDNWGHFGGFLGGYLISWTRIAHPRHPEGIKHLFLAIACLILALSSIVTSILHGLFFLPG
jgi:rhomboid protease GluP